MMNTRVSATLIFGGVLMVGSSSIKAQAVGIEYTAEWQTDMKGHYDWLNLLCTSAQWSVSREISIQVSTISTAKTSPEPLCEDLLTYSNIEAGNIPLTFSRMGLDLTFGKAEIFVGINNVNEDYFLSDLTSWFTNSSFGISPTISCNYDIANYPMASWCVHWRQRMGHFALQSSLYPGRGYSRILGHDNLFSLDLRRDGIFSISSVDYKNDGNYYVLGIALHRGVCIADAEAGADQATTSSAPKALSVAPWILGEWRLPAGLGLVAHGSVSTVHSGCRAYAGLGLIYEGGTVEPAVALNYASFSWSHEWACELGARMPLLSGAAYLQPTMHLISNDSHSLGCIAMIRFGLEL